MFCKSPISRTIIEQTDNPDLLPNVSGDSRTTYIEGFGLTEREFKLIQELEPAPADSSSDKVIKSCVCQLDLKGFDAELAVISGRGKERRAHAPIDRRTRQRPFRVAPGILRGVLKFPRLNCLQLQGALPCDSLDSLTHCCRSWC